MKIHWMRVIIDMIPEKMTTGKLEQIMLKIIQNETQR